MSSNFSKLRLLGIRREGGVDKVSKRVELQNILKQSVTTTTYTAYHKLFTLFVF